MNKTLQCTLLNIRNLKSSDIIQLFHVFRRVWKKVIMEISQGKFAHIG